LKAAAGRHRTRIVLCARGARAALRASRVSEVCVARSGQSLPGACQRLTSRASRSARAWNSAVLSLQLWPPNARMSLVARRSVLGSLRVNSHKQAAGVCCASTAWLWYAGTLRPRALPGSPRFSGPQASPVRSYKKVSLASKGHRQLTSELDAMDELSISDAQPPPESTTAHPAPSTSAAQAIEFLMLTQNLKASGSFGSPGCLSMAWGRYSWPAPALLRQGQHLPRRPQSARDGYAAAWPGRRASQTTCIA